MLPQLYALTVNANKFREFTDFHGSYRHYTAARNFFGNSGLFLCSVSG